MFRVGIVGPQSTIDRILMNSKTVKRDVLFLSFPYDKIIETKEIVEKNKNEIDFWVFSGKISYQIAKKLFSNGEHLIYIDHTEAGIFKGLIKFTYETNAFFDGFSIDEISQSHLENAFKQLPISQEQVYLRTFSETTSTNELIQFHEQHWREQKTKGAITCYEEVYLHLKEQGIPVVRISTSDIEIRHTLEILDEKIKTFSFKDAQIAVLLIDIVELEKYFKSSKETYELQLLSLDLKRILIALSEQLNGYLLEKGTGQYIIFSSRGDVEREMTKIEKAVEDLTLGSGLTTGVGIGYGDSVFLAEFHTHKALEHSIETHTIVIAQENGFLEKLESKHVKEHALPHFNDPIFIESLEKQSINVKHYIELFALIKRAGIKEFTIKDISSQLKKDERNTRRFIENLCKVGLAASIGYDPAPTRGRPRRIYKLTSRQKVDL